MDIYLASPNTQQQAEHCEDMNVLLSFAIFSDWLYRYQQTFDKILIDSGAYSELNSGKKIDIEMYKDWSLQWHNKAVAIAGLDDIRGDYKKSLSNYNKIPWSFPTWHDTDPLEVIPDLVAIAKERKTWLGIGLLPPRQNKEKIIRQALELIPENIHLHGWALRAYSHISRFNSMDSTNWWRDAMGLRTLNQLKHLTYGECLEIVVKRYKRENRMMDKSTHSQQTTIFDLINDEKGI